MMTLSYRSRLAAVAAGALLMQTAAAEAANFTAQTTPTGGQGANVCVFMDGGNNEIAGAQMDLNWDPNCMESAAGSSKPKCRSNPDTNKTVQSALKSPGLLKAIMISFSDVDPIPDGLLFCCEFTLKGNDSCNVGITNLIGSSGQGQRMPVQAVAPRGSYTGGGGNTGTYVPPAGSDSAGYNSGGSAGSNNGGGASGAGGGSNPGSGSGGGAGTTGGGSAQAGGAGSTAGGAAAGGAAAGAAGGVGANAGGAPGSGGGMPQGGTQGGAQPGSVPQNGGGNVAVGEGATGGTTDTGDTALAKTKTPAAAAAAVTTPTPKSAAAASTPTAKPAASPTPKAPAATQTPAGSSGGGWGCTMIRR